MKVAELAPGPLARTPALDKVSVNQVPVAQLEGREVGELTDGEKLNCARQFFLTGNLSAIARDQRIRYNDLLDMARAPWWGEEVRNLEREANAQLKVRMTRMLGKTLDELENRLERGDLVWRDHGLRVVPVPARDLASIAGTVFDKKRQIEEAESGFGTSEGKRLLALAEALRAHHIPQAEIYDAEVISPAMPGGNKAAGLVPSECSETIKSQVGGGTGNG